MGNFVHREFCRVYMVERLIRDLSLVINWEMGEIKTKAGKDVLPIHRARNTVPLL